MQEKINELLEEVILEAKVLGITPSGKISTEVLINRRAKKRFGCCKRQKGLLGTSFVIELGGHVAETGDESIIKSILIHEVLHTSEGCYNHSRQWKRLAQKVKEAYGYDIKRTSSYEALGMETPEGLARQKEDREEEPRYLLVCTNCGKRIGRQRLSKAVSKPGLYRCVCGGKLQRER